MKVLVDGDSCPVLDDVLEIAGRSEVSVVVVADCAHEIPEREGVEVVIADAGRESADIALANRAGEGDVVVTNDYGLAALALARKARALSPRGGEFTPAAMSGLLMRRHLAAKVRRSGGRTRGPARFTDADRRRFREKLVAVLRGRACA